MSKKITREDGHRAINKNMGFESELYSVYSDIVNNRHLPAVAFVKYIYDNYESFNYIKNIIEKLDKSGMTICSNNIKTIIDYKESILMGNKSLQEKLKPKFEKINDVKSVIDKNDIRSNCYYSQKKKETYINLEIDSYLDSDKPYDYKEYNRLKYRIMRNIKNVSNEKYIEFINSKYNIKKIDKNEIEQLITILKYFIYNLKSNLWEFELYYYMISSRSKELKSLSKDNKNIQDLIKIIDLYTKKALEELSDIPVNKNNSVIIVCKSKITTMNNMIKSYSALLDKLIVLKKGLDNNDLRGIRLSTAGIKDDFILNIIGEVKTLLNGYNDISGVSISKENEVKDAYLKKYVYDSKEKTYTN